ncbi:MAG: substrate-binding domain-containing protein [Lachnospiraceae bacterium]|nr:substrate-binding domain-containing protein [Lachnospiraceae bacterium]
MSEEKGSRDRKYGIVTILLIVTVLISGLVTVCSMIYFRVRIRTDILQSDGESREYSGYYALVTSDNEDAFWSTVFDGMRDEGEMTDVYVYRAGRNLATEYDKYDLMEMAIASGVDGIIYEADDTAESMTLINKANSEGIPVVTVRSDTPGSKRKSFIGVSFYNLGTEYGKLILSASREAYARHNGDESDVSVLVLTDEDMRDTSQNVVVTALKETIEKRPESYPGITVATAKIDNSGEFTAEESIRKVLTDPGLPDIIVCLNEINTVSVYQAIVEQNKVGASTIIGYYDSETILRAIEKQIIYATITIDSQQLGHDCIDALNEYIKYKRVSEYYGVDYKIIDMSNIDDYLKGGEDNE